MYIDKYQQILGTLNIQYGGNDNDDIMINRYA